MGDTGLEPVVDSSEKCEVRGRGAAESGAVGVRAGRGGADLQRVLEAWPRLDANTRAKIVDLLGDV